MKELTNITISGDYLYVFCFDTDKKEDELTFELNLRPFYSQNFEDLEHQIFGEWIYSRADKYFLNSFIYNVSNVLECLFRTVKISVNIDGFAKKIGETNCLFLGILVYLTSAIKEAFCLDDTWHREVENDIPEEVQNLIDAGVPVYFGTPQFLLDEEY